MRHGKPLGSFGEGTGFSGDGEIVSLVAIFKDFLWYLFAGNTSFDLRVTI